MHSGCALIVNVQRKIPKIFSELERKKMLSYQFLGLGNDAKTKSFSHILRRQQKTFRYNIFYQNLYLILGYCFNKVTRINLLVYKEIISVLVE